MSPARTVGAFRLLSFFAAILTVAAVWLTAATGASAGAAGAAAPTIGTTPYPPNPPGDLHVVAVTATSITLAWTASTPGCCSVSGYDVTYTQAFNDVVWTQEVGNVTTATLTSNIRPATQYNLRVSAHDDLGHRSAASNSVTVVTPLSDTGADVTPPSAPAGLTLTGVTPDGAALTWTPSTDDVGVTGYNVYRFDGLYVSTLLATVTTTSYTAPLASTQNNFYVRARDAAGNVSISSTMVTVTSTPSTPTTPTTPTAGPPACRATYANTAQWTGGFVADLTVTNTGAAPVTGWTLTVQFGGDQRIATAWNATFRQSGPAVTLTNLAWNRVIAPGAGATVGLLGSWSASNAKPTAIALNGLPCALG